VIADGEFLPFRRGSFDLVIATQVLEYVRDPRETMRQIHDVLKPGGVLLGSAAAYVPLIAENDFWRFTRPGLSVMLAPFVQVEIVPELNSLSSVLRTINLAMNSFMRYDAGRAVYRATACPIVNIGVRCSLLRRMPRAQSSDRDIASCALRTKQRSSAFINA